MEALTVGQVTGITGLTVRTLHHYDEIGLVVPRQRSEAGYRLYGKPEVERLQEVLFLKEFGFSLPEIRSIVEKPSYGRRNALVHQRRLLEAKAEHLLAMIDTIDLALAAEREREREDTEMSSNEMLGVFGDFDPEAHEPETRERWGDTDAYRESKCRTATYTQRDWEQIQRDSAVIDGEFAALLDVDVPRDGPAARALVERHRAHITKWFYECTPEIHAGLAQLYATDARFAEAMDRTRPGLAGYMSEAITAAAEEP
jgi:DNA-binding transcriptional MerR regulator